MKYTGTITGTSRHGIFVEFEEYFTALLHTSKMSEITKAAFINREYNPGDQLEFYISEITKDNRIILTEEDPAIKLEKFQKYILENHDRVQQSTIAAIMKFGVIINIGDITGLVPIKEFKRNRIFINNFVNGDKIPVVFDEFKDDKLVFKLHIASN